MSGLVVTVQTDEQKAASSKRLADLLSKAEGAGIMPDAISDHLERLIKDAGAPGGDATTPTAEQMADPKWVRANQHVIVLARRAGRLRSSGDLRR